MPYIVTVAATPGERSRVKFNGTVLIVDLLKQFGVASPELLLSIQSIVLRSTIMLCYGTGAGHGALTSRKRDPAETQLRDAFNRRHSEHAWQRNPHGSVCDKKSDNYCTYCTGYILALLNCRISEHTIRQPPSTPPNHHFIP